MTNPPAFDARRPSLLLALLLAAAAVHGQTAINQDVAIAGMGGGYLSDLPGFPVAILVPGSYKLTGNLVVPPGVSGIEIFGSGVTLDLNGFEIRTAASCPRNENTWTVSCPNSLGKVGVDIKHGGNAVRNGRVSGFEQGVRFKGGDLIENLLVENNQQGVTSTAPSATRSLIRQVRAQNNMWSGVSGYSALVVGSAASANGGYGFHLSSSMLLDSHAAGNKGSGIEGESTLGLAVGRSTSWNNLGGDFKDVHSLGDNMNSAHQRF